MFASGLFRCSLAWRRTHVLVHVCVCDGENAEWASRVAWILTQACDEEGIYKNVLSCPHAREGKSALIHSESYLLSIQWELFLL